MSHEAVDVALSVFVAGLILAWPILLLRDLVRNVRRRLRLRRLTRHAAAAARVAREREDARTLLARDSRPLVRHAS